MSRREFPASVKREAFQRCAGFCEVHRLPAGIGDFPSRCWNVAKELDHITPCMAGGEPTLENSAFLCREHHVAKTASDQACRKKRNAHKPRKDRPKSGWFHRGPKLAPKPIKSRGFAKAQPQRSASRPLTKGVRRG